MRHLVVLSIVVLLAGIAPSANGALISGTLSGTVNVRDQTSDIDSLFGISAVSPTVQLFSATTEVGGFSTLLMEFVESNGQVAWTLDFDQNRIGHPNSPFSLGNARLDFVALTDTVYDISGFYALTGGDVFSLYVNLDDATTGQRLFQHQVASVETINEHFIVGQPGGDNRNVIIGSPTGNLIGGHAYYLVIETATRDPFRSGAGASATGAVDFRIGTATAAVPEPSSALLLIAGGLSSVGLRLRRNRAVADR